MRKKVSRLLIDPSDFDPERLKTPEVQLWKSDIFLRLIPLDEAKDMVRKREAKVITSQAILLLPALD
jgi:hypothetical protein